MDAAAPPPTPPAVGPLAPVRESERIVTIDVLRGVALLGIFLVNMQFFALPMMEAVGLGDQALADGPTSHRLAWAFVKSFCEFKFLSMFSMLFGIGLIIQAQRAAARGRAFAPVYLRRLGVLAVFGLVHALMLWYGDILFIYAVLGTILLIAHRMRATTLLRIAAACLVLNTLLSASCLSLMLIGARIEAAAAAEQATEEVTEPAEAEPEAAADGEAGPLNEAGSDAGPADGTGPPEEESDPTSLARVNVIERLRDGPVSPAWLEGERTAYRDGPFLDAFIFRAASYAMAFISAFFGYGWRVLTMFLLGAALMKLDFFSPERRAWQRRVCAIGLGIGVPLELGVAATFVAVDFQVTWQLVVAGVVHELASFALSLGYVGAVCLLVRPGTGGLVQRLFSSAGRLALSVYLLETITTTAIMYWWGFGRFDDFTRPELLAITVGIYAGLMVAATVWLRFFTIGPFEWLWRTLTYLRRQPMRRQSAPPSVDGAT